MSDVIRVLWAPILRVFDRWRGGGPGAGAHATEAAPAAATDPGADAPASAPDSGQSVAGPTAASTAPDSITDFAAHLEFLGYTVEPTPDGWHYARHPARYNFSLRSIEDGLRMLCAITIGAALPGGRRAWLEWVNMANDRALLCRFAIVEDDGGVQTLRVRHLFSGGYDRRTFGAAIDRWHEDLALLRYAPPPDQQADDDAGEETPATVIN